MKYKTTFIILIVSVVVFLSISGVSNAVSEKSQSRLIRLHYQNTSGEKGVTTFDYNMNGDINIAIWELLDGTRSSLNYYSYRNGNLVKKYREFSDSLTSSNIYKYDENHHLISEYFERSDNVTGKTHYEYDDKGRLITAYCDGLNGWFFGIIKYMYSPDGKKIKADIIQKQKKTGVIEYTYNTEGNLHEETWDFGGKWKQIFTYEYDLIPESAPLYYSSSNVFLTNSKYRVVKENYTYANEKGGPSLYKYDENGKLITKTFLRSDSLTTNTRYLYDGHGKLIKSYRICSDGRIVIFDYKYSDAGNLVERLFKRSDSVTGSELYEYDENERLKKAYYKNVDFWLNGVINFSYNENGLLSNGNFSGNDNFDADLSFIYNEKRNLEKIHWSFSFGKFQSYLFEYELIQ